ncbi:MAG TPA: RyR domain-containing protein [Reyranella sp.]|nr:RyR domain-containing protein [Reyranella sp.]
MPEVKERDSPRALWIALGIDRLKSATTIVVRRRSVAAIWRDLDSSTQRAVLKVVLMGGLAVFGFGHFVYLAWHGLHESCGAFLLKCAVETAQLFTLQYSPRGTGETSIVTQLARLVFPAAAIFVGAISLSRQFSRRFFAWRTAHRRKHVVLVGSSDISVALARNYREELGRPVIAIVPTEPGPAILPIEKAGADIVIGDASSPATLRKAGVPRATALIAAEDIGGAVVAVGSAVSQVGRERADQLPPLPFVMRLSHQELRDIATAHLSQSLRESRIALRLYVRERTIARGLLARYPADWGLPPGSHDIHAVIVGLGEMGSELLLQLARIATPSTGRRMIVTAIDRDADAQRHRLLSEYPNLGLCAELRFKQAEVHSGAISKQDVEDWLQSPLAATSIYVCCGDDRVNLSVALGLRRACSHVGADTAPIFVDQRAGAVQVKALPHIHGRGLDTLRIIAFGAIEEEADPFFLLEEEIDDLARRLHEHYLATVSTPGPALVPWPQLDETYRAANRSLADHLQMKLRALGLHAASTVTDADWTWRTDDQPELEALARQEHERWCRDRWLRGWTFAERRDDSRLLHPDLVPYEKLDEAGKNKDRSIVLDLPKQLASLGIGLKRDRRIGIWFENAASAPADALIDRLLAMLEEDRTGEPAVHCQLVLPLRVSAEWRVAAALAARASAGVDIAIMRYPGRDDAASNIDRATVEKAIAAADRAFVLTPAGADDSASLAALRSVCDAVALVSHDVKLVKSSS